MRAVGLRENIQPRTCCISESIQQDRGWIFSRTARTVEISKSLIIWHWTFVKNGGERTREAKGQSPKHLQKTLGKMFSWLAKLSFLKLHPSNRQVTDKYRRVTDEHRRVQTSTDEYRRVTDE